jgi:hypothetical protein
MSSSARRLRGEGYRSRRPRRSTSSYL